MGKTLTASYNYEISLQELVDYIVNKYKLQPGDIPNYVHVSLSTESRDSGLSKATMGISLTWNKDVQEPKT